MLILASTNVLEMELDLIEKKFFSFQGGRFGSKVIIIFGVDMSSSVHVKKGKNI